MKLEVCIDRFESALAAKEGGADRIEVCGALGLGGITPSYGLIEQCIALGGLEVMVMIRPRAGAFTYGPDEISTMIRDIAVAKSLGVHGVVFGMLDNNRRVDVGVCRRLVDEARPLSITFHRAFDLTPEPLEALDTLMEIGVDRLLTSGQAASAVEGVSLISQLVRRAGNSLSVMAGSGVRADNVAGLIRATGVREVHSSASEIVSNDSMGSVLVTRITKVDAVRAMVLAMNEFSPP